MRFTRILIPIALMAAGFVALGPAPSQDPPPQDPQQRGVEVMARGPVHEAYAEPTDAKPEAGPIINKQPPELIAEEPPEQKPEGDNVEWISGYWAWDDDSNDFLWVSGFWREAPPGRVWIAGYWHQVQDGWQWSPGFWTTAEASEVTYVPPPPEPVESGPSTPAPQEDMVYSPGVWVWRETRFLWRPGFWVEFRPGWVWVPAHYVWTPAGFVFVEGYWDYPLADRGLLFAPVRFDRAVMVREFRYTPYYVVQPDFLIGALFVQPRRHHYYFGDYFEPAYRERGYVAWTDYRVARQVIDPNYAYYRARFRDESWSRNLEALYTARFRGEIARPPRTLVAQREVASNIVNIGNKMVTNNINITNVQNVTVLAPVTKINNTRVTALASLAKNAPAERGANERQTIKVTSINREERQRTVQRVEQAQKVGQQRKQEEARVVQSGAPAKSTDKPHTAKLELPRATRPEGAANRPGAGTANRMTPPPAPAGAGRTEDRATPGTADRGRDARPAPDRDRDATRPTTPPTARDPRDRDRDATRPVPDRDRDTTRPTTPPARDPRDRDATRPMPDRDRDNTRPTTPPARDPRDKEPMRPTTPPVTPPRDRDTTPDRDRETRPTTPPRDREPDRNPPPLRRPEDPTRPPPIRDPRDTSRPDVTRDPRDAQKPSAGDKRDPTNPPPVGRGKPDVDRTDRPMPPTRDRNDQPDVQPNRPMNNNPPGGARPGPMPPTGNKDRDRAQDEKERQKDKEKKDKDKDDKQ